MEKPGHPIKSRKTDNDTPNQKGRHDNTNQFTNMGECKFEKPFSSLYENPKVQQHATNNPDFPKSPYVQNTNHPPNSNLGMTRLENLSPKPFPELSQESLTGQESYPTFGNRYQQQSSADQFTDLRQSDDGEVKRLNTLVDAQRKIISQMQQQLKDERDRNKKPAISDAMFSPLSGVKQKTSSAAAIEPGDNIDRKSVV